MTIEDLIETAAGIHRINTKPINMGLYHTKPITDMALQVYSGRALTQRQANYAISILLKYKNQLTASIGKDVIPMLDSPVYRKAFRALSNKTVTISPQDLTINVEFPYDDSIIEKIRQYRNEFFSKKSSGFITSDILWDEKHWVFSLKEENIKFIASELIPLGFTADDLFTEYLEQIRQVEKDFEQYVPMLTYESGKFLYKNASANLPALDTSDIEEALFRAKQAGISIWDDSVDHIISTSAIDPITMCIIKSCDIISVPNSYPITTLVPSLTHSTRCLFVIPGGNELEPVMAAVSLLKTMSITAAEISVLFRLPNTTNKDFNQYIKDSGLNNPVSDTTRAVFIMGKLPKSLCESNMHFDVIVTMGNTNPNYMLKNYIKNHHCVIKYNLTNQTKDLNFDHL